MMGMMHQIWFSIVHHNFFPDNGMEASNLNKPSIYAFPLMYFAFSLSHKADIKKYTVSSWPLGLHVAALTFI